MAALLSEGIERCWRAPFFIHLLTSGLLLPCSFYLFIYPPLPPFPSLSILAILEALSSCSFYLPHSRLSFWHFLYSELAL